MIRFLELPLNDAIADDLGKLNIDFAFQPIFEKKSMKVVGHEALMRPLGCSPIQLIEQYKNQGNLHTLELATFFGAVKKYYELGLEGIISINSFPSECFSREESAVFFKCFPDIAPYMQVEMLEYTDFDFDKWVLKREQIRSSNIHIAVDDYGSGNNFMMAVNLFQPDEVKLDLSLVSGIHQSQQMQERFVKLINKLHDRNINVLAEGIELKEELEFMMTTDIDYLQGYYLGRPS